MNYLYLVIIILILLSLFFGFLPKKIHCYLTNGNCPPDYFYLIISLLLFISALYLKHENYLINLL